MDESTREAGPTQPVTARCVDETTRRIVNTSQGQLGQVTAMVAVGPPPKGTVGAGSWLIAETEDMPPAMIGWTL